MADWLDVAGRLDEGRPAVEDTQRYVLACQMMGYEHPDLTSHPSQIRDWYDSEDGLDLRALDGDCAELRSVVGVAAAALRTQRDQVAELAAAWTGSGADAALCFLQRHCDTANAVAVEVRAAAQRCESLRDNLWHLLDAKVATTIAIDDRILVQRPAWLAAADVVTTGAGNRPTADEVVNQQIKPHVDNEICNEWLPEMRSTQAGIAASYDMVIDRLAAGPRVYFEIPGDLLPGSSPWQSVPPTAGIATVAPSAATPAVPGDLPPVAALSAPLNPSTAATAAPTTPSDLGVMSGGAPGSGDWDGASGSAGLGGLGALASRIVAAVDDLLGSAVEPLCDSLAPDDPLGTEDPFAKDDGNDADQKPDAGLDRTKEVKEAAELCEAEGFAPAEPPMDHPPVATPQPLGEPPPMDHPPVATPQPPAERTGGVPPMNGLPPGGSTPCEIAADELPQAGQ